MRRLIAVGFVALLLFSGSAIAFSGTEHHDATLIAFSVAQQATDGSMAVPERMRQTLARLLQPDPRHGYTLADVTVAVDWFQGAAILTDDSIAFPHMARRQHQLIWKLLAAHRDRDHFQKDAINAYAAFHDEAMAAARNSDYARALYTEAVGLHFLEDFLSAGHVVTPRNGFHDVVAAALHDRYNSKGVNALVPNREAAWAPLLVAMSKVVPQKLESISLTQDDIDAFKRPSAEMFQMHGDDHLQQNTQQKVLLILLAARSIQEVLEAPSAPGGMILRPCYEPRSAKSSNSTIVKPQIDHGSIRNVSGGFNLISSNRAWPRVVPGCNEVGSVKVLEYDLKHDKDLTLPFLDAPGVGLIINIGVSPDLKHHQQSIDIGRILLTRDPNHSVHVRDTNDDHITPNTFSSPLPLQYGSVHLSLLRGDGYKALGLLEELAYHVGGTTTSLLVGVRRYSKGDLRQYRFDHGAKVAVGFQVINLNVTVERAHRYTANGRVEPQLFVSPGFDIQLSGSWVRTGVSRLGAWAKSKFGDAKKRP